jgi:sRNA-binding protein
LTAAQNITAIVKIYDGRLDMPGRGRSSFTKRQKEHTRQQKQRDKAERRIQRKDEPAGAPGDSSELDLDELQRHAAEQAALFQMGADDADISSIPREREKTEP